MAQGEIVILDDLFGVRVYSMTRPIQRAVPASRVEDVLEVLPTAVRLASLQLTLAELTGARQGAIINLGVRYSEDVDAELLVAGAVAGRVKVAVHYENMAIRLVEVAPSPLEARGVRSTGYLLGRDLHTDYVKDYNHKRPDKFSSVTIRKFRDIHHLFLRNLQAHTGALDGYQLAAVDQSTFEELLDQIRRPDAVYGVMRVEAWPPHQLDVHPVAGPLIEARTTPLHVSEESRAFSAKLAQGGTTWSRSWSCWPPPSAHRWSAPSATTRTWCPAACVPRGGTSSSSTCR